MALSDCAKCWETPCKCGHEYSSWSITALEDQIAMLQRVLNRKKMEALHEKTRRDR